MRTTAHYHAEADAAAQRGDFRVALAIVTEILRREPDDYRARLKAGLCLGALGRPRDGASAALLVARGLAHRGYALAAIGACRDALTLEPTHPGVKPVLENLHDLFGGLEGRAVSREPPPINPVAVEDDDFVVRPDAPDLLERARAVAIADPDAGQALPSAEREPVPFFSDLGQSAFTDLIHRLNFVKLGPNTPVVRQGDAGGSLFIIVSGEVEVARRDESERTQVLARLAAGHIFGEMSLLTQKPRNASVLTTQPTELFEIDRQALEAVARRHPAILEDLVRFARRRMIKNLIGTSPVFRTLDEDERLTIISAFETRVAKPREVLIKDGQAPLGLFMVLEGELEVSLPDEDGEQVILGYLREGEVVGEISLLDNSLTKARVAAVERSVVLHLPKAKFDELVEAHPQLSAYLRELSSERLVETEAAAAEGHVVDADELVLI